MSRITKEIAADVAKQITSHKEKELKDLKEKLSQFAYDCYLKRLPGDLLDLYKNYKGYFRNAYQIRLPSAFGYKYISFPKDKPLPEHYDFGYFIPTPEEGKVLAKLLNKIEDLSKEKDELQSQIELALYSLRTYNNVEKEFPEAYKLLPERITTSLAVNITSIREKL